MVYRFLPLTLLCALPLVCRLDSSAQLGDRHVLSETGSTRATAYGMSHKIVDWEDFTMVGWLDQPARILVNRFHRKTGKWEDPVQIGEGMSNHAGPALAIDSTGVIHAVFGPHHGPFAYRYTLKPGNIQAWSNPIEFGNMATYPSLVCTPDDTLHLTYRSSGTDPWRVLYQKKPAGGTWSEPVALFENDVLDYMWTGHALAVDPEGHLHLVYCHYEHVGKKGKAIHYLVSRDGGETWLDQEGNKPALPTGFDSSSTILQDPDMDIRIKSTVIGPEGEPWFVTNHYAQRPRTVVLRHKAHPTWKEINLLPVVQEHFPGMEPVDANITFDRDGHLYVACTISQATSATPAEVTFWGHESSELVLLVSGDQGRSFQVLPLDEPDPATPRWMPSLKRSSNHHPIDHPALLYTSGGRGEGVHGGPNTTVYFVEIETKEGAR